MNTRETLERRVVELKALAAKFEDGSHYTSADVKAVNEAAAEVETLTTLLKGEKLVASLGAPNPSPYAALLGVAGEAPRPSGWGDAFVAAAWNGEVKGSLIPSGSVVVPSLLSGIVSNADRPTSILDLVPKIPLQGTDQFSYLRETVRTNNAAVVAVGALKPTSVFSVERQDETVKTIAHLSEGIPRQWLADATLLSDYVERSLRSGVMLSVEDEVVNGDGTGEHFLGLDDTVGIQTQAFSSTTIITCRKAVTKLEAYQINGGAFVFHPNDWEWIELAAETTGNYMLGDTLPVDRAQRKLWGQPVVTSTACSAGKGFLVDFAGSTQLWERESVTVDWSENTYDPDALGEGVGATDFSRNLIRFRAEGRFGFAVTRPKGVVEIATAA